MLPNDDKKQYLLTKTVVLKVWENTRRNIIAVKSITILKLSFYLDG